MSIAFINSATAANLAAGGNSFNSASLNTTSANLILVALTENGGVAAGSISDSKGNTWHTASVNNFGGASTIRATLFYAWDHGGSALSVGSGHTISYTNTGSPEAAMVIAWFSGSKISADPFDIQANHGVSFGSNVQPGSLTPSADNYLVITTESLDGAAASVESVTAGWAKTNIQANGTVSWGANLAYLIQTTATAVNPTWSSSTACTRVSLIASFAPAPTPVTQTLADSYTISDGLSGQFGLLPIETVSFSDAFQGGFGIFPSDSVSLSDSNLASSNFRVLIGDSDAFSDLIAFSLGNNFLVGDANSLSDGFVGGFGFSGIADVVSLLDAFVGGFGFGSNETLTFSDIQNQLAQYGIIPSDAFNLLDSFNTFLSSVTLAVTASEVVALVDGTVGLLMTLNPALDVDSVVLGDSATFKVLAIGARSIPYRQLFRGLNDLAS